VTQARNEHITRETQRQIARLQELGFYHSIELPDGRVLAGLQSVEVLRRRLSYFPIPEDLRGKRVLDIGAWDGWFSFEMERRGAEVVAFDYVTTPQFLEARRLLGSKVDYTTGDICKVSHKDLGYFDIVLFLGVLYHVKHPVLALENVCSMTKDLACIESYVTDDGSDLNAMPTLEFYESTELRGQFDNWCGPNVACLMAMARAAGFASVKLECVVDHRGHITARRQWQEPPGEAPGPRLLSAENSLSRDKGFSIDADDYVSLWFKGPPGLTCDTVFAEIGPYAARPVTIHPSGPDGWVAGCKLPPGLKPGWHEVKLRLPGTRFSNVVRIPVDIAAEEEAALRAGAAPLPRIISVTDGRDWTPSRVRTGKDACLSLWLDGVPEHWRAKDFSVRINGVAYTPAFVSPYDDQGYKQVNVILPPGLAPGAARLTILHQGRESEPVEFELIA
jgi:tRNA (mo5U34)-methyltransferase